VKALELVLVMASEQVLVPVLVLVLVLENMYQQPLSNQLNNLHFDNHKLIQRRSILRQEVNILPYKVPVMALVPVLELVPV
jgi:hypothetical protein